MKKHLIHVPDLKKRMSVPELMDDPDSDQQLLTNTLEQFRLINRFLTPVRRLLKRHVFKRMMQEPEREYHLVDLGAGGCETAAWLLRQANRRGLRLRITACDHDDRVVQYAREKYGNTPHLTIRQCSVLEIDNLQPIDFVYANHLLHHLSDTNIQALLGSLSQLDQAKVIICDVYRSRTVYAGFYLISSVLFHNSFSRYDGLLSIRKGFTKDELSTLIGKATHQGTSYKIERMAPGHIVLLRGQN